VTGGRINLGYAPCDIHSAVKIRLFFFWGGGANIVNLVTRGDLVSWHDALNSRRNYVSRLSLKLFTYKI
jgi:hypothetical protein